MSPAKERARRMGDLWDLIVKARGLGVVVTDLDVLEQAAALESQVQLEVFIAYWGGGTLRSIARERGVSHVDIHKLLRAAEENVATKLGELVIQRARATSNKSA